MKASIIWPAKSAFTILWETYQSQKKLKKVNEGGKDVREKKL